jgi:hypothetical protein
MGWSGSHPQSATTKFRRVFGRSTCGGQSRPESAAAPPAGAASSARASRLPPPNLPESRGATTPPGGRANRERRNEGLRSRWRELHGAVDAPERPRIQFRGLRPFPATVPPVAGVGSTPSARDRMAVDRSSAHFASTPAWSPTAELGATQFTRGPGTELTCRSYGAWIGGPGGGEVGVEVGREGGGTGGGEVGVELGSEGGGEAGGLAFHASRSTCSRAFAPANPSSGCSRVTSSR